jgi:Dyp-type peroxidase family
MPVDLQQGPINPDDPLYHDLLTNLQGNILRPHGRSHALHIFLQFTATPAQVRGWMRDFANAYVTSALQQRQDAVAFRATRQLTLFGNAFLSATGYAALGYTPDAIAQAFAPSQDVWDEYAIPLKFASGMSAYAAELNDPPLTAWEAPYQERQDAMLLLADADEAFLLRHAQTVLASAQTVAKVLTVERGQILRDEAGAVVEPFGYADGISNPRFFHHPDASDTLDLVLVPDPLASSPSGTLADCCGSYLVFRKLEQNVRGFHQRIQELATSLHGNTALAYALAMGRFQDGTPVVLSDTDGHGRLNDFDYTGDPDGLKCPYHAHIRRINPRGDSVFITSPEEKRQAQIRAERHHRLVRRSSSYGVSPVVTRSDYPLEQLPTSNAGLLFLCFQRSLSNQFGFLQIEWANSGAKGGSQIPIGVDPVIGQPAAQQQDVEQPRWPRQWGQADFMAFAMRDFVTLKGGAFFFAPSLPFLQHLTD